MSYLLDKYKKYDIEYILYNNIIKIHKKIPVKVFTQLKIDMIRWEVQVKDIIVESWG